MSNNFSFRDGVRVGGFLNSRYAVRPDANPKEIDVLGLSTELGIYRIDGDTLTSCQGAERPIEFDTTTQVCTLIIYQRVPDEKIDADTSLLEGNWKVVKS